MTGKTPAEPDNAGHESYAITDVTHIAKAVIKAAPVREHRWPAWEAFTAAMENGWAELSAEYPWEKPEKATWVSFAHARHALTAMLEAIPDSDERDRLAKVTAKEAERIEQRMEVGIPADAAASSGLRCMVCSKPLPAGSKASRRTCGDSCRQKAYQARKRGQRQAQGSRQVVMGQGA